VDQFVTHMVIFHRINSAEFLRDLHRRTKWNMELARDRESLFEADKSGHNGAIEGEAMAKVALLSRSLPLDRLAVAKISEEFLLIM